MHQQYDSQSFQILDENISLRLQKDDKITLNTAKKLPKCC